VKQKKGESVEEYYERVVVPAAKIQPAPGEQIRMTWFINWLNIEYEKYINILPSDTLEETLASKQKIKMCKTTNEMLKEIESNREPSSNSNKNEQRKLERLKTQYH
jgi:hypothetical protein